MKKSITIFTILLLASFNSIFANQSSNLPHVKINVEPYSTLYEGEIIDCNISNANKFFWEIENGNEHTTFYGEDILLFDPEPMPLEKEYVNLTLYAENEDGIACDTIPVKIKRIYFGDIHWHTDISDARYSIDEMYTNAIKDNYLDFVACTDHGELIDLPNIIFGGVRHNDFIKTIVDFLLGRSEWELMREKAKEYYTPGKFSTFLAFEWTSAQWSPGGWDGWEDVGHINFYYRDVYEDVPKFSFYSKLDFDDIFEAMAKEWEKGHLNIAFPHHPQGKIYFNIFGKKLPCSFTINWSYMAEGMESKGARDKILRGGEVYSRWGLAIGQYYTPEIPWLYGYDEDSFYNLTDAWMENAFWEWSENCKQCKFVMIASSDTHNVNRPGSSLGDLGNMGNPSGIVAVYAPHNVREEIWDALNECDAYALQLHKIRAMAKFDGKIAYGKWINCSKPLKIEITALATFPENDSSNKSMRPHGYDNDLNFKITNIWIVKKDREKGRPWCKVIAHFTPNDKIAVVSYEDCDVMSCDFYWVAIKQSNGIDDFMAFLGPIFIYNIRE
ncbi:MAG TPA: DUF3604 domain-containing protein [Thermoplasmatales archaeon]|nr:DUF3604 domain-containing protein [Thermoplasmatales archaeon]